jgi:hypothetical protein
MSTDRVRDCLTNPVLRLRCIDTGAIVACEADIPAIARYGDHALARSTCQRMTVEKRGRSGIAVADDARQRPARPLVVDDPPQSGDLEAPKSIPLGNRWRDPPWTGVQKAIASDDQRLTERVRVPGPPGAGSNGTLALAARAGTGASNSGSMRTVPVNHSAGPLADGCEPLRVISIRPPTGRERRVRRRRDDKRSTLQCALFGRLPMSSPTRAVAIN